MCGPAKILLFFLCFFLTQGFSYAQKDSSNRKNDSLNATILQDYNIKLEQIRQQRIADSVKKAELEAQLSSLRTTDNLKKEELQKQLESLRETEIRRLAQKRNEIDSLRSTAIGYPVNGFFTDTLFVIYSKQGSFSPKDRAEALTGRIKDLADVLVFSADSLKLVEAENTIDLVYGEDIIMSVSENDALWENETKQEAAKKYKAIISNAVINYRSETSFATLAKEIGLALLIILIIVVLIFYIGKLFAYSSKKIRGEEGRRINGIKIKSYVLFDSKQQVNAFLWVNNILKWFVILLSVYVALPILFGIFPWTKDFAEVLFGYILKPVQRIFAGLWNYLPNLITIIVVIIFFRYVLKGIHFLKTEIERGNLHLNGFYPDWANPTYQIIRILIYAFMMVVIFPYLPGSDSEIFKGVTVFLGFLFTFGSAGSLSNIVSGLILTYMRLFRIGDRVKFGDVVGDVIEKSLLVTRIRTIKNEIISIPNSTIMNSHTINYSSDAPVNGLIVHTTVTIGYDVPWRDMHKVLIEAAMKTKLILRKPEPFVLQTSLDDFYVSYQINGYIKEPNKQAVIYSDLHQNIQDVCNEHGIEILSPHYRAARDGNATTIPPGYMPADYQAPAFNIQMRKDGEA